MSLAKHCVTGRRLGSACAWGFAIVLLAAVSAPARAAVAPPFVHGMWIWNSASVLDTPGGAEALRDFCKSEDINEVYLSVPERLPGGQATDLSRLIGLLHRANIRVEALLSSVDADESGAPRDKLVRRAQNVVHFNEEHAATPFEGIHLDIEPQQRPENKGAGNLQFLPGLVDAWRSVRALAESARMTVNADISNKLLKGDSDQRHRLLSAVPRVTLMMYELQLPRGRGKLRTEGRQGARREPPISGPRFRRTRRPASGHDGHCPAHTRLRRSAARPAEATRRREPWQSPLPGLGATFL